MGASRVVLVETSTSQCWTLRNTAIYWQWRSVLLLALLWVLPIAQPAHAQGRPEIVWMRGGHRWASPKSRFLPMGK